jgi:juvenile hormone diol kinase
MRKGADVMLTELQKRKLRRLFKFYDSNGNGFIEAADFDLIHTRFCQAAGWERGSASYERLRAGLSNRWKRIQAHADTNRDNRVSLEEWLSYVDQMLQSDEAYEAEVKGIASMAFQAFDRNRDERIDLEEYRGLHRAHGLDAATAEELFRDLDLNRDGFISHDEYLHLIGQFYKSEDPGAPGNRLFGNM